MAKSTVEHKPLSEIVKAGDILAEVSYVKVESLQWQYSSGNAVHVCDLKTGLEYTIRGESLIDQYESADHFDTTETITRTALAELFVNVAHRPFTVVFRKVDGTGRTLRGHLVKHETFMGRSTVVDLDITKGSPLRQVDHRTIESLIVSRVKYVVKEK